MYTFVLYLGLNNVGGKSDYVNAIVQALAHVTPIRNYFLLLSDDNTNDNNEADNDTTTQSHLHWSNPSHCYQQLIGIHVWRLADDGGE